MPKINQGQVVAAIDPSLGSAAVITAIDTVDVKRLQPKVFQADKPEERLHKRIKRWETHAANMCGWISKGLRPRLIVIEGYSFGSKGRATVSLGEFGGVFRSWLIANFDQSDVYEVPPKSLKMFVTSNGNAKKVEMVAALAKQYGVTYKTDDEYDALGLWLIGRAILNPKLCKNAKQRQVISQLTS